MKKAFKTLKSHKYFNYIKLGLLFVVGLLLILNFTSSVYSAFAITSFTASPTTVISGNPTTLFWSTTEANSCKLSGGIFSNTPTPPNNSASTGNLTTTTTYTLTCEIPDIIPGPVGYCGGNLIPLPAGIPSWYEYYEQTGLSGCAQFATIDGCMADGAIPGIGCPVLGCYVAGCYWFTP